MNKERFFQIKLNDEEFKRIKRNKQSILLRLNVEKFKNINTSDKVILFNDKNKKLKKKVKKIYKYFTFEELCNNIKKKELGYRKNNNIECVLGKEYSREDIQKYGVFGIELKKKKYIFRKVLFGILFIGLFFLSYKFIGNKIDGANIKKFSGIINEVSKERIDYIFIQINPSFVLTIKGNKVNDVACLNDDCVSIYNDIDVKGKDLNDSIDILYDIVKEKGFDISNGIKVRTASNVIVESRDYIIVEYIDNVKEKELLNEVKNNEEIKNVSNDDYYSKLWGELKKDFNYDNVYTCNMNDSKELECYVILETGISKDNDYNSDTESQFNKLQSILTDSSNKIFTTLEKFNFDVINYKVLINGIEFGYVPLFTNNSNGKIDIYKNVLTAEKTDILDSDVCDSGFAEYENGKCQVRDGVYIIPLDKVNLVNPTSAVNNMIILDNGLTENILSNYEAYKMISRMIEMR